MNDQQLPQGYRLRLGSSIDQALLLKLMQRTYQELHPGSNISHLAETVERYFSQETPLWFVETAPAGNSQGLLTYTQVVGCLWAGSAIDQVKGDRHAHIFLLYVSPSHRQQGIASVLMQQVEAWARERGDRQVALQVFEFNQPAIRLYEKFGYQVQSLLMTKGLNTQE
ncbi:MULTISPECIES: GNAT family N-acetyltransferase [unclassified Leptolyngbya]|uniref:GNAT family N-acetyltransferase n=1 Tax=unclassified Leptolyngbya TaxID=2650499 RepID=UPI0032204D2A